MADFLVRTATQADLALIKGLIEQTRLNPARLDWRRFVVAFSSNGDFMGCAQAKLHGTGLLELASVAVRKRYRGQGIASAMIEVLLSAQPRPIYLMCRSALGPFYAKFGFRILEAGELPKYFRRTIQVISGLEVLQQMQETIIVMALE